MLTIKYHRVANEVIKKVVHHQKLDFEIFSNWIPAGSGNFEKTQNDGRYRENCNTYRETITCETHQIQSLKMIFNHCNKLDCETCFIHASSDRARTLNEKLLEFQNEARKHGIKTGNIVHVVFSPKKDLALKRMKDYNEFLKYRSEEIFNMLKDCGMFAGVIFTQLWSYKCKICSKEEEKCHCQEKELERKLNPHFHVVGFGYLMGNKEFREKYEDWLYLNLGRRNDGYHTIFYILTNVALWRKADGKLKPAYQSFGYLKTSNFVQIKEKVKSVSDRCPTCKKPRKRVISGVEVIPQSEQIQDSISSLHTSNTQIIPLDVYTNNESRMLTKHNQKKVILLNVSETSLILGTEVKYKRVVREYRILNIGGLRKITMQNKVQYRKDKKKWERNEKEGNGYG